MTSAEIRDVIAGVAARDLGWKGPLPEGDLTERLDSLQRLSLVVGLEDHFRVKLDFEDGELRSVDDLVAALEQKLNG